jgi:hypothetical protein
VRNRREVKRNFQQPCAFHRANSRRPKGADFSTVPTQCQVKFLPSHWLRPKVSPNLMLTFDAFPSIVVLQHKEIAMRKINILDDIVEVLYQSAIAIPEVFLTYDVTKIELVVDDEDRPTVFEIVFVESADSEIVIGEITLMEDFTAYFELFDEDEGIIDES